MRVLCACFQETRATLRRGRVPSTGGRDRSASLHLAIAYPSITAIWLRLSAALGPSIVSIGNCRGYRQRKSEVQQILLPLYKICCVGLGSYATARLPTGRIHPETYRCLQEAVLCLRKGVWCSQMPINGRDTAFQRSASSRIAMFRRALHTSTDAARSQLVAGNIAY